jgi:hypothetical protein
LAISSASSGLSGFSILPPFDWADAALAAIANMAVKSMVFFMAVIALLKRA